MRRMIISASILLMVSATAAAAPDSDSVLCIDRPGENGRMNITPVTVSIEGGTELTILGEEQVCLRSYREGPVQLQLRFAYPYFGPGEKLRWSKTDILQVTLKHGGSTKLMLCPRVQNRNNPQWVQTGWRRMWVLSPPESPKACGPEYAHLKPR
jgi:hypothetical protein